MIVGVNGMTGGAGNVVYDQTCFLSCIEQPVLHPSMNSIGISTNVSISQINIALSDQN